MLQETITIVKKAGDLIKKTRITGEFSVSRKRDGSLVTTADVQCEKFLVDSILKSFGNSEIIISEEEVAAGKSIMANHKDPFWLIDPIDSTNSYINGINDYCINLSYMEKKLPTLGIIYAPALNTLWYAVKGKGAYKQVGSQPAEKIKVRKIPTGTTAVVSFAGHQLNNEVINKYNIKHELTVASAIKFCYIAEGKADYYIRKRHHASDWDIASGHIIIEEAGGEFLIDEAQGFEYGSPPYLAPDLVAKGLS